MECKLYINGQWVETKSGRIIDDINPADHSLVAKVHTAGPEEITAAIDAAAKAAPAWAAVLANDREAYLLRAADHMHNNMAKYANWLIEESGSCFMKAFGEIHPEFAAKYDLKGVVYAELKLDPLFTVKTGRLRFSALDRYPAVSRDIALVVKSEVTAAQIVESIRKAGRKIIRNIEVFDVYEGEHIEQGKKSVALRITYQAQDHTLKEEEIADAHQAIMKNLSSRVKAEQRA